MSTMVGLGRAHGPGVGTVVFGLELGGKLKNYVAHGFVGALIDFIYYYYFFKESL